MIGCFYSYPLTYVPIEKRHAQVRPEEVQEAALCGRVTKARWEGAGHCRGPEPQLCPVV